MRSTILRSTLAVCAALTVVPASAGAVVGGTPDTANQYANVAVLRFIDTDTDTRWRCSGTLIEPNVIITAAHCTEDADLVYYSFAVDRPTVEPDAAGATGWTLGGSNLDDEDNIFTHPDWDGDLQNNSLDDIGLIILDAPVTGIAPATVAPEGYSLDAVPHGTAFTAVGYGIRYV